MNIEGEKRMNRFQRFINVFLGLAGIFIFSVSLCGDGPIGFYQTRMGFAWWVPGTEPDFQLMAVGSMAVLFSMLGSISLELRRLRIDINLRRW